MLDEHLFNNIGGLAAGNIGPGCDRCGLSAGLGRAFRLCMGLRVWMGRGPVSPKLPFRMNGLWLPATQQAYAKKGA